MIDDLYSRQLSIDDFIGIPAENIRGKKIAITGTLPYKRQQVVDWIRYCGGIYCTSVSSRTDFLCVGHIRITKAMTSNTTNKLAKATDIISKGGNLQILTPDDLFRALDAAVMIAEGMNIA